MRTVGANKGAGTPGFRLTKAAKRFVRPMFSRRGVTTLIKVDESKGVTQPEFLNLTDKAGQKTPGAGGYKGATEALQVPRTPPAPGRGKRRIKTPRTGPLKRR